MNSRARVVALLVALSLFTVAPGAARADTDTLKRSVGNLLMWPLDLVMSPVVAIDTIQYNLRYVEDSLPVKIAYPVPGFFWITGVQAGASVLRGVTGLLEFFPGLILLPFETGMDPLFTPAERNEALVDWRTPLMNVRFGIDYTSVPY